MTLSAGSIIESSYRVLSLISPEIFRSPYPFVDVPPNTNDFRLGELPIEVGNHLQFTFDLLDEWEFDLQLEKIEPVNAKMKKPKILEYHGEPPAQYGEEGDDEE